MAISKFLITAVACTAVLSGCAKKEKAIDKEFSSSQKSAAEAKKPSKDVFDEFYMDDNKDDVKKEVNKVGTFNGTFSQNGRYSVQVSTVASRTAADRLSSVLNGKGYPAYVAEVDNPTPALMGTYYRVRIGTFDGYSQAKDFGESILKPSGYDYWIDRKSNDNIGIQGSGFGSSTPASTYEAAPSSSYGSSYYSTPEPTTPEPTVESTPQPSTAAPSSESIPALESTSVSEWTAPAPEPAKPAEPTPAPAPEQPKAATPAPAAPAASEPAPAPANDDWGTDDWGTESGW